MDLAAVFPWIAAWAMIFGPLTSWYARRRARQPLVWLVYGAIIGPAAGLILAGSPPGRCPICDEPVTGLATMCPSCGHRYDRPLERWVAQAEAVALESRPGPLRRTAALPPRAPLGPPRAPAPSAAEAPGSRPVAPSGVAATAPDAAAPGQAAPSPGQAAPSPGQAAPTPGQVEPGPTLSADGWPTALVASGVLLPGPHALAAGCHYLLARHGPSLWILGPLETTPSTVRFERPIGRLLVSGHAGRLDIATRSQEGQGPSLSFESVVSLDAEAVAELTGEPAGKPSPTSSGGGEPGWASRP